MDINTATWVAGISGGAIGAAGAFGTARRQRAWDRRAAEQQKADQDRAERQSRVHAAVASLLSAQTELQLSMIAVTADHKLGFYGRHAAFATNRMPDIMARVLHHETEIELAADQDELIEAARAVLDRLIEVNEALKKERYRRSDGDSIDALNQAAMNLRNVTRKASGLSLYSPPDAVQLCQAQPPSTGI